MAIDVLNTGTAAGSGDGESLRSAMTKVNSNFGVAENAASKIVQASSADTTSDKVMLTDHAWRGAQLGDYFTYGGTANAITLTSANLRAGGTLIKGMKFRFEATTPNTGATTIAVDGGSAIACVTPTGVALPAGFIRTDVFTECEYDGSVFVVSRKVESGGSGGAYWTKWEDGRYYEESVETVEPSISVSNYFGSTSGTSYFGDSTVSFSNSITGAPRIFISSNDEGAARAFRAGSITSTSFVLRVFSNASGPSAAIDMAWSAKGKWY